MNRNKCLKFITQKIADVKLGRFYSENDTILKIPNAIINTYQVDEAGYVLFFIPRAHLLQQEYDSSFYTKIVFLRKGINFYVNAEGFARLINDPEELYNYNLSYPEITKALTTHILVKVKIVKADYFEKIPVTETVLNKVKASIYSIIASVEPEVKQFHFIRKQKQVHSFAFFHNVMRNLFPRIQFFQ
jgi:hypothetical protein